MSAPFWEPMAAVPPQIAIGIALPASPIDGQEAVLVDSLAVPTYVWRFRYVASISDAYKWVFIGGSPLSQTVAANFQTASAALIDITGGPALTVPRAGIYEIGYGASVYEPATNIYVDMNIMVGAVAPIPADYVRHRGVTGDFLSLGRNGLRKTCAANDVIKVQAKTDGSSIGQWENRWMTIIPVRVS